MTFRIQSSSPNNEYTKNIDSFISASTDIEGASKVANTFIVFEEVGGMLARS